MIIWNKIKPFLKDLNVNLNELSPSILCENNKLLPHLLGYIEEDIIFAALEKIDIKVFKKTNQKIVLINSNFILIQKNESGRKELAAFLVNPFSELLKHNMYLKCQESGLNIKSTTPLGVISSKNKVFLNLKTANTIAGGNNLEFEQIIQKAINANASDVHIGARNENNIFIKFRVFGGLVESGFPDIPKSNYKVLANKILVKANLNGGSYGRFTEASFKYKTQDNHKHDIRLQLNPLVYKFDDGKNIPYIVLRLHGALTSFKTIETIGLTDYQKTIIKAVSRHNSGVVIVSGPTGSGKTTLLYAIIAEVQRQQQGLNIMTLEDPVEVKLPGTEQTNINKGLNVTFAEGIKAILRSDVDVAMVGEIRDTKTANGVIRLDNIGHLVLTTMHSKNTFSVIEILNKEMDVSLSRIANALSLIISIRLVKKVCSKCSEDIEAGIHLNETSKNKYIDYFDSLATIIKVANKKGCKFCTNGYFGRLIVAEVFVVDSKIKKMILEEASVDALYDYVRKQKHKDIWDHGFQLVNNQKTTIEALVSVLPVKISYGTQFERHEADRI